MLHNSLANAENLSTNHLLDEILRSVSAKRVFSLRSFPLELSARMGGDCGFLHIASPKEELLFTTGCRDEGREINFDVLGEKSLQKSGVWLFLQKEKDSLLPPMTIVTRTVENGIRFQIGRESSESWMLLQRISKLFFSFFLLLGITSLLLSLILVKMALSPIEITRERMKKLSTRSRTELLPEKGNGDELDVLYHQVNQLLRHNRQLMSEMQQSLDNVAHDLRTPMARLRSVAEYSLQEEDPERLREALADCLEESELILRILQVMMNVAEAESGTMRLDVEKKDVRESISRAVQIYEYVAEEKRISIEIKFDAPLVVSVDETRITQVWANLLDNAIKYGRKDGKIEISARKEADGIIVSFTDNGMGISLSEQGRIWERLYRGDRSRTEKGLGLGLCYVKAVVEAHGGRVKVISSLHNGACFEVFLPQEALL